MEYRRLGHSGLQVSVVGLGTNNFGRRLPDPDMAARIVRTAVDSGINLLDTSNDYGGAHVSEQYIGAAIKGIRERVVIVTKVAASMGDGPNQAGAGRTHILQQVDESLRALGTDYIDVYLVHRPDPATPMDETLRVLDDLVRAGKVRYTGCSNFAAWEIAEAVWTSRSRGYVPFIASQPEYSMLRRDAEAEHIPSCVAHGVGLLPYYPLASGFLTGRYRKGEDVPEGTRMALAANQAKRWLTDENFEMLDSISRFCEQAGRTMTEVAFAWLFANPAVGSVIAGASRPEQVEENARIGDLKLTPDEKAELDEILAPVAPPVVGGASVQSRTSLSARTR